jgi:hypothetical protein
MLEVEELHSARRYSTVSVPSMPPSR